MRKLIGSALLALGLVALPAAAYAQMHPGAKHEFGVDLGIAYQKPSGFDGTFGAALPIGDVRVGFVSSGKMMFEPRVALAFESGGGNTVYALVPGLNVLYAMGQGHKEGPYVTVGAQLLAADNGLSSGVAFGFNGGIGTRIPYGSGAWRLEAFLSYDLESTDLGIPNTLTIGARVGISLWH